MHVRANIPQRPHEARRPRAGQACSGVRKSTTVQRAEENRIHDCIYNFCLVCSLVVLKLLGGTPVDSQFGTDYFRTRGKYSVLYEFHMATRQKTPYFNCTIRPLILIFTHITWWVDA